MSERLNDEALERSCVAANCRMNRERDLSGTNGYDREIRLHPLEFLRTRIRPGSVVRWLDLCCGTGRALVEAAEEITRGGQEQAINVVGIDLVDFFWPAPELECLQRIQASVHRHEPEGEFDLITCVHGLHYLGDKLDLICRACHWLREDGLFVGNLDLANLRHSDGRPLARTVARLMRQVGLEYDRARRLVICRGRKEVRLPLVYQGADDQAGPNYTGQAAVNSFYVSGSSSGLANGLQ